MSSSSPSLSAPATPSRRRHHTHHQQELTPRMESTMLNVMLQGQSQEMVMLGCTNHSLQRTTESQQKEITCLLETIRNQQELINTQKEKIRHQQIHIENQDDRIEKLEEMMVMMSRQRGSNFLSGPHTPIELLHSASSFFSNVLGTVPPPPTNLPLPLSRPITPPPRKTVSTGTQTDPFGTPNAKLAVTIPVGTIGAMFLTPHKKPAAAPPPITVTPITPIPADKGNNNYKNTMMATPPDTPIKVDFDAVVKKEKEGMVMGMDSETVWMRIWKMLGLHLLVWYFSY